MPKTISEIYTEYKIMPSLQMHMLRVAAVASLICDNFEEPLPKEDIITACLLHDMGNIIKSDLMLFPDFREPEGLPYWQGVKDEYVKKYGQNEHKATVLILHELGLGKNFIEIIDHVDFKLSCIIQENDSLIYRIVNYADWRVDPFGVVSYEHRMEEGKRRYENSNRTFGGVDETERLRLVGCGKEIEKQIFAKCKIKPEDITDETVASVIEELRNFVVK